MTKIVNLRNNIFNMMRYDRDEFLYLYNKTIDRLASYSVEEIENMEELDIFKEGIGSTDFKVFNIIKILNFTMKKFNPRFDTHERQIYCDARLRYIENRKKEIQKQLDNTSNLEKIPGQEVEDIVNLKDELLKLTFEEKDNHIHFYETDDETKIDNSEVGENIENVKVVGGYLDAVGIVETLEEKTPDKGFIKEGVTTYTEHVLNSFPEQKACIQKMKDDFEMLEKKYADIPEILNNSDDKVEKYSIFDLPRKIYEEIGNSIGNEFKDWNVHGKDFYKHLPTVLYNAILNVIHKHKDEILETINKPLVLKFMEKNNYVERVADSWDISVPDNYHAELSFHDKIIPTTLELFKIVEKPYTDSIIASVLKDSIKSISKILGHELTDPVIDDYIVRYKLVDKLKKELENKDEKTFLAINMAKQDKVNLNAFIEATKVPEKSNVQLFDENIKDYITPEQFIKTLDKYVKDVTTNSGDKND